LRGAQRKHYRGEQKHFERIFPMVSRKRGSPPTRYFLDLPAFAPCSADDQIFDLLLRGVRHDLLLVELILGAIRAPRHDLRSVRVADARQRLQLPCAISVEPIDSRWARQDSNLRPPACEGCRDG